MKIAIIFGKGLDGCGVEKYASIFQSYTSCDVYTYKGKKFFRGGSHVKKYINFDDDNIVSLADKINNNYDIVIFNSMPNNNGFSSKYVKSFIFDFVFKITKPITVYMMHEIKSITFDRIPMHVAVANHCDIVYNFSEKTDYVKQIRGVLDHKKERFKRFISPLELKYDSLPFEEKEKRIVYAGRWTTMKGPIRLLNFTELDSEFDAKLIGIERSIGASQDVLRHKNCVYKLHTPKSYKEFLQCKENTLGDYLPDIGREIISKSLFGYSGFTLPKEPHNYGDRMEYSQAEIILYGTVPVFDKHYLENNYSSEGKPFIDYNFAIWSEKSDLSDALPKMIELANNKDMYDEYRKRGIEFIRREFSVDVVIPNMISEIKKIGKQQNYLSFNELLVKIYGSSNEFYDMIRMFPENVPSLNIKDCLNKELSYYDGKKRVVWKEMKQKSSEIKNFFDME